MLSIHAQRLADSQAIAALARTLHDAIPEGTAEATVFAGAIAFLCASAEMSANKAAIAQLMHAAANELSKGIGAFAVAHH